MQSERLNDIKRLMLEIHSNGGEFDASKISHYIGSSVPFMGAGGFIDKDNIVVFRERFSFGAIAKYFDMATFIVQQLCCATNKHSLEFYKKPRSEVTALDVANKLQELIDEYNRRRDM